MAPNTAAGVRVEIRPGEGGDDAALFADQLASAISAWARRNQHPVTLDRSDSRTITLTLPARARNMVDPLAGTHRIQREPRNGKGKRHTSTATVAVLSPPTTHITVDRDDVVERVFRGSGPGGQHRNTCASDVSLTDLSTGITVVASGRSQWQNRQRAWAELEQRLVDRAEAHAAAEVNRERRTQTRTDRSAKGWTWNDQRDEVVDHATGRTYRMRKMLAGRIPTGS